MKRYIKRIFYTLAVILLGLFVFQLIEYHTFKQKTEAQAMSKAAETTAAFKNEIESLLNRVKTEAKTLGESFGENDFTVEEIKTIIRETSLGFDEIRGVTACYEPNSFNDETRLFCPYYNKSTGEYLFVEESYDYTIKGSGTAWYTNVVENGASWIDPYYGSGAQEWFIDYGVPFYYASGPKSGEVRGIIDFSLGAGDFKNIVHQLSVGKTAFSYITSKNGSFIAHPNADYVGTKNLSDAIAEETNEDVKQALTAMTQNAAGHFSYYDSENNSEAYFFYDTIDASGYAIGMGFLRNDLVNDQKQTHQRYIRLTLTLSFIIVILLLLYFGRDDLDYREIEVLSGIATLLLFANVFLIGYLQHGLKTEIMPNESPPIVDNSSLEAYVAQQVARAETLKIEAPRPIPTGLYIERMEFADSYNVNLSGFIWQKYPLSFNRSGVSQNISVLHFNIHQKRKLLNAFVTYLIPIFVALSLIYILILACEKTEARQGIIESMAAFFFVLIFSHIDLRKDVVTADLMFMEYFYFITYAAIILSTFNLITYTKSTVSFFDYNNNQIFRVCYFPAFFMILLIVMLIKFY